MMMMMMNMYDIMMEPVLIDFDFLIYHSDVLIVITTYFD